MLTEHLGFKDYKLRMRTTLILGLVVVILGVGRYHIWSVEASSGATHGAQQAAPAAAGTITISNFRFDPKEVTVSKGGTIEWVDDTGRHTVTADDGSFKSDMMTAGAHFQHTFEMPGTFPYHCENHGSAGGKNMAGTVIVKWPRAPAANVCAPRLSRGFILPASLAPTESIRHWSVSRLQHVAAGRVLCLF
jgi:plastocyanin